MKNFLKFYEGYLKTIKIVRFDPIILLISANLTHSLKGVVFLYILNHDMK